MGEDANSMAEVRGDLNAPVHHSFRDSLSRSTKKVPIYLFRTDSDPKFNNIQ